MQGESGATPRSLAALKSELALQLYLRDYFSFFFNVSCTCFNALHDSQLGSEQYGEPIGI
jgi:hypothetical protein